MRLGAYICFLLAIVCAGVWVAHGQHMATLTEKLVSKEVEDEFGDKEVVKEWEETFEIGLDIAGPTGGGLIFLGFGLLLVNRRRNRAPAPEGETGEG